MSEDAAEYHTGQPKYDYRLDGRGLHRTFLVLGAIQALDRPTVTSISQELGFQKSTVQRSVDLLESEFPGLVLCRDGPVLGIEAWGVLTPKVVQDFYQGYLKVR